MGLEVEKAALRRGHTVVCRLGRDWDSSSLTEAEMAIEFSRPEAVVANLNRCLDAGVPVVCGTTGWDQSFESVAEAFRRAKLGLFTSSNFSIGVYSFIRASGLLARLNSKREAQFRILEIHHQHKLDRPSGTAIRLAERVLEHRTELDTWALKDQAGPAQLPIESIREGEVPGTHLLEIQTAQDVIRLEHRALNREGFAEGAVAAAEFLSGKSGVYGMDDLFSNL